MIIGWLKSKLWLKSRRVGVPSTLWFQKQLLKKRYQDKKLNQTYELYHLRNNKRLKETKQN